MDVDVSDTVESLRTKISEACNIEGAFVYNWPPWEDLMPDTLGALGFTEGMSLQPCVDLTIFVYAVTGTMCKLRVDNLMSVEEVKYFLIKQTGIPLGEQRLLFGLTELQDAHTLQDYDVVAESACSWSG